MSAREARVVASTPPSVVPGGQTPADAGAPTVQLDTCHQTSTTERAPNAPRGLLDCPNNNLVLVDTRTGRTVHGRCRRLVCYACISWRGYRVARAIGLAAPTHAVLLTRVGNTWSAVQRGVNRFVEYLRRDGIAIELAYHVEQDPSGGNHHVHAWAHGGALDDEVVKATAVRVGFGEFAGVMGWEAADGPGDPVVKYGLKAVLDRPTGATDLWPEAQNFLAMNGGRLVHQTHGFYRAGAGGERLGTKEAITRALHGVSTPPTYKVIGTARGDARILSAPV